MPATALVRAVGGKTMHLRFSAGHDHIVEVVDRLALSLRAAEVERLIEACQAIVCACQEVHKVCGERKLSYCEAL